jgi:hypothetical protein
MTVQGARSALIRRTRRAVTDPEQQNIVDLEWGGT